MGMLDIVFWICNEIIIIFAGFVTISPCVFFGNQSSWESQAEVMIQQEVYITLKHTIQTCKKLSTVPTVVVQKKQNSYFCGTL
eukprot:4837828-Ditylum_brightwellii.AAC.1